MKHKRFASMFLAVAMMAATLTGCGGGSSSGGASGDDGNTVKIGGVGPLTGDYANYGTSVYNGAKLAVEEINAAGGINGMTVELDFQDSQGDQDSAVSAYGKLMDWGMDVSLGGVLSGETQSINAAAKNDDVLLLTPSGSAMAAIEGNDKAFRVCFNDPAQGTASANYMADNDLASRVAVFYASDVDYSVGLYETFKEQCAARNIEIVEVQTFTSSNNSDFSTQINAIAASDADMVFIPIYAAEAATFMTQAQGKLDVPCFGCDGLDGILTKVSDPAVVEGVMLLTPFAADSSDAKVQEFVAAYKEAYNATPDQFAADGYDAVYAIKAAMEQAGVTSTAETFGSKLAQAMTQIEVEGVTGTMKWTADGEVTKNAQAMVIRDGVAVAFEK